MLPRPGRRMAGGSSSAYPGLRRRRLGPRNLQVRRRWVEPGLLPIPPTDEVHDWSPDGQWLLTIRQGRLYIMRPDASEQRQVFRWRGDYPRFSPDGKSFVFTWMMAQRHGVFVMDLDGGGQRPVLEVELGTVASPCWSPDGKELAVVTYELQPKNRAIASARITVCELAGKGRKVFTLPPGTTPRRPDWR